MNEDVFYKFPTALMRAQGFVNKETGELVKLTPLAKQVYVYMLSRNRFFTSDLKSEHYETQQTIADACGCEYKVAGKILRSFVDNGIVRADKLRPNGVGQWRWFYREVTEMNLWFSEKPVDNKNEKVQNTQTVCEYTDEFLAGINWE